MGGNSVLVDTSHLPGFFTRFPVRLHHDKEGIHQFTLDLIKSRGQQGSEAHKQAIYRHAMSGPDLNIYALWFCEANLDKLKPVIELMEVTWYHDDAVEELPLDVATFEGKKLSHALDEEHDADPVADDEWGKRIVWLREICNQMKAMDGDNWTELREATRELLHMESKHRKWNCLQEYFDFRKAHIGNRFMTALLRWSLGMQLTANESMAVQPYVDAIALWIAITNDLMSWKRESIQPTDRIANTVHFLMGHEGLSEELAVDLTRGILVKQEARVLELKKGLYVDENISPGLKGYVEALDTYMGAVFYWSMLSPRYNSPDCFLSPDEVCLIQGPWAAFKRTQFKQ